MKGASQGTVIRNSLVDYIKIIIMQQVKTGDKVKVHYHGKLTSGETFDSSNGRPPLEFEVGSGMVIKGFDDGVTGMKVGDKKTINIPAESAYGEKNPDMLIEYPKSQFPENIELQIGTDLMMSSASGQQFQVKIADIKEDVVILDANHPLAGEELIFDIELVEIVGGKPLIIMP
jgi:peptidylprolyl isomerase